MPSQTPTILFAENHVELAATLAEQLARNRYVGQLRTMSEPELKAVIDRILRHCRDWSEGREYELTACLDYLENICFVLSIALAEVAYALYVVRDAIVDILAADNQFESIEKIPQVKRFFERLVRDLLRRY